jgi:uncharacterized protein
VLKLINMDTEYTQNVQEFLGLKRIGIAGFSSKNDNPGNYIYKKLKDNGYEVIAINPKAADIQGVECYASISSVPEPLDGIVICTHPSITESVIEESAKAGIKLAWIHKAIGEGSYSIAAIEKAKKLGIKVIPIGCPMMFVKPDIFHKCFKFFMRKKLKAAY